MKKIVLWLMVTVISISMLSVFSLTGCKKEAAEEEAVEETVEEAEEVEEVVEEEAVEEIVPKDEPVNIIMFADILVPAMEEMFARFTADTGWPVEIEPIPGGQDFFNIVPARLAAGEGPDLLMAHGNPVEYILYNPADNFVDITEYVTENISGTKVPEALINTNAFNGVNYGIPWGPVTLRGYYYNKNVMEAAGVGIPTSAIDFLENVAPKVKAAGFDPIYGMGQDAWGHGVEVEMFIADEFVTTDIQDRINNNEATFADSAFLRGYEWQLAVLEAGYYNNDLLVGTYDGAVQAMVDGTAFMTALTVNTMGRFPDDANANYLGGFFLSEEGNRAYYALPNFAYLVKESSGGNNQEGAMAYYEWFTKPENLLEYYSALRTTSAYIGIENEMWPYASDLKAMFDAQDPFTVTLGASPKQTGQYSAQVTAKTATPLEACEQMQQDFAASAKAAGLEAYQD